jgi:hypothetical protein
MVSQDRISLTAARDGFEERIMLYRYLKSSDWTVVLLLTIVFTMGTTASSQTTHPANQLSPKANVIKQSSHSQGSPENGVLGALVLRDVPGHSRVQIQIGRRLTDPLLKGNDVHIRILSESGREVPSISKQKDSDVLMGIGTAGMITCLADFQIQGDGDDVNSVEVRYAGATYLLRMVKYKG